MILLKRSSGVGRALCALVVLAMGPIVSCAKDAGPIRDAQAESAASVTSRLQGRWFLVSFQPEVKLEPTLQGLLDAQLQNMVVTVQGTNLTAEGPGVTVARKFAVHDAYENHFKATIIDSYGIALESGADFSPGLLVVDGYTAPWRGKATFRR